jgi:hypothetical protein
MVSKFNILILLHTEMLIGLREETNRISIDNMREMIKEGETTKIKIEGESF